ncbi:MAG: hypothetical protein ACKPKO_60170, partial [Candidatus Fonsibacter sp.]
MELLLLVIAEQDVRPTFTVGDQVVVQNLTQLRRNGRLGTVQSVLVDPSRYSVQLVGRLALTLAPAFIRLRVPSDHAHGTPWQLPPLHALFGGS